MATPVLWIDNLPVAELDGGGVKITSKSGDELFRHRMSRNTFRHFVEKSIRMLDAADLAEQGNVVDWRDRQEIVKTRRKKPAKAATFEEQLMANYQPPDQV